MELNKINSVGSWGKASDDLNQNFSKVNNAVEQIKNATTRNKGYFSSDAELKSTFPSANMGDIAYVGRAYPYQTWSWNGSTWEKKNDAGGEESVNLGNYYTKNETDGKFTETDEKLSELGSKVIRLTGIARSSDSAGVTKEGDVYFNTDTRLLRKCVDFAKKLYETIPFHVDAIYEVGDLLYYYDAKSNNLEKYLGNIQKQLKKYEIKEVVFRSLDLSKLNIGDVYYNVKEKAFKEKTGYNTSEFLNLENGNEVVYKNERYLFMSDQLKIASSNLAEFDSLDNLDSIHFSNHTVSSDGSLGVNKARLCSDFLLINGLHIDIADGYLMYIYYYDKDKKPLGINEDGLSGNVYLGHPFSYYARLVFMHSDKTTEISTIDGVVNSVKGIYVSRNEIPLLSKRLSLTEKDLERNFTVEPSEFNLLHSYRTGIEVGETVNVTPYKDTSLSCWKTSCVEGDKFAIKGGGGNLGRLWCFTDSSYKVLSVSEPSAGGKGITTNIIAPKETAYLFVNLNNYNENEDAIIKNGGWIETESLKVTKQLLSKEEVNQVLDNLGVKCVPIVDFCLDYTYIKEHIKNVGDIYYDYKNNRLRRCTDALNGKFTDYGFSRTETYILEGKLYNYDGEKLYTDGNSFDKDKIALFDSTGFINKSVSSTTGSPTHVNAARLCSPLLYIDGNTRIKVKDGYAFYYYIFDKKGVFKGLNENNNTDVQFPPIQCLARIVFKKLDNSNIYQSEDIVEIFEGLYKTSESIVSENQSFVFSDISPWEPTEVDEGYSNPTSGSGRDTKREDWTAENKYKYYEFLEHYYDTYLGVTDNYKVLKRGLWVDSANTGHEVFEYDFCPKDYKYTIMLSAGLNTDETQGIWGLATFIRCLMNEEEPQMALMKKNIRFKVIPILNASGFDEDLLRYNYVDGTNPNMNFNYKDSWERNTQAWTSKGDYPDSCLETRGLKKWINDHYGIALLWLDLHTGRWDGEYPNKKIMDIRFGNPSSYFSQFNSAHVPLIKQFYIDKGYITSSDSIGGANSQRENVDYQKHRYAVDVCGINSAMPEMHLESTGYGSDGFTNNSPQGIKAYVLQIRQLVIFAVNNV